MISIFRKIKTYNTCKSIPMENFYEAMGTSDYRWLIIGYGYDNEIKVSDKKLKKLEEEWKVLFDEYIVLKNDQTVIDSLNARMRIEKLKNKLFWGGARLKLFIYNPTKENRDKLAVWGFNINMSNDLKKEVDRVIRNLKGFRTKVNIAVSKYEKKLEKANKREVRSVDDQIVSVGGILELKYLIDKKTTTMATWISYCNQAASVIKRQNKKNG